MSYFRKLFFQAGQNCIELILSMFEGQSGSVLLDCGCGNGKFTQQIMGKIKDCREVHGIELIEGYCEGAKKRGLIVH